MVRCTSRTVKLSTKFTKSRPKVSNTTIAKARVQCPNCPKSYTRQENLRHHVEREHKSEIDSLSRFSSRKGMSCLQCDQTFRSLIKLTTHLKTIHMLMFEESKHTFKSLEAFKKWKTNIEMETNIGYSQNCGPSVSSRGKTIYYHCNRSGNERKDRMAKVKNSRGSMKINRYCTSYIKLLKKPTGQLESTYCATHYGHEMLSSLVKTPNGDISMKDDDFFNQNFSECASKSWCYTQNYPAINELCSTLKNCKNPAYAIKTRSTTEKERVQARNMKAEIKFKHTTRKTEIDRTKFNEFKQYKLVMHRLRNYFDA